jgi:hypothetical protein
MLLEPLLISRYDKSKHLAKRKRPYLRGPEAQPLEKIT